MYDPNALYHHGVLGMKWGVRRYQNPDGTYNSAGKKRYGIGDGEPYKNVPASKQNSANLSKGKNDSAKKKSDHQIKLEAIYKQNGMSKKEAEEAAANRVKAEKIVLGVAGVSVAALATVYAVKKYKEYANDIVLDTEKNPLIRMQVFDGKSQQKGALYAVYNPKDSEKYGGYVKNILGQHQFGIGGNANDSVYRMQLDYGSKFKVASDKHAREEFASMMKSNPAFAKKVVDDYEHGGNVQALMRGLIVGNVSADHPERMSKGKLDRLYDAFNIGIAGHKDGDAQTMFFDHMKAKGYGAIKDRNDGKWSGFNTKSAIITLDELKSFQATKLSDNEVDRAAEKAQRLLQGEEWKRFFKHQAMVAGAVGGIAAISSRSAENRAKSMYNAGVSQKEIAKQLGVSQSEVSKLINN